MYKTKKILRNIIFILLFIFIGLIIWGYIRILPSDIQFTNVSSSSFTVSWNTKFPTKGAAVVIDNKNRIPVSLSLGQVNSYDTRDVKSAELVSTFETANNIWNGDSYKVDINDFVKELIISEKGTYYTHHIQVNGLDPEKSYSVMVGDGIFLFNSKYFSDIADINTVSIPENIKTPVPVYGQIKDGNGNWFAMFSVLNLANGEYDIQSKYTNESKNEKLTTIVVSGSTVSSEQKDENLEERPFIKSPLFYILLILLIPLLISFGWYAGKFIQKKKQTKDR